MRIDSQGYASVVIPDPPLCEEPCQTSYCSIHSSIDPILPSPHDYEVPVISRTVQLPPVLRRPLARQRAVSDLEPTKTPRELPGEITQAREVSPDQAEQESIDSVNDEVFDSGIENSNEGFEISSPTTHPHKAQSLSEQPAAKESDQLRPRAMTNHSSKPSLGHSDSKLCIILGQQPGVVV